MTSIESGSFALPAGVRVGFGTASLLGTRSRPDAVRLIEGAVEAGVRYFDTARMYGSGGAESVVGEVARRHRDRMIVVSKAGILPPSLSFPARLTRKLAGMAGTKAPAFAEPRFGVFDPAGFAASVETSLKELGCERIDLLLLHEAEPADITPELLRMLEELKQAGKIGGYGLATGPAETRDIARRYPALASIAQIPDSLWQRNLPMLSGANIGVVGTHSIMGTRFSDLVARLRSDAALRGRWDAALGFDTRDSAMLGRAFMAEALAANPTGLVLFSSGNPANIAANVELATREPGADAGRIAALRGLLPTS